MQQARPFKAAKSAPLRAVKSVRVKTHRSGRGNQMPRVLVGMRSITQQTVTA
jgi:hypothetical protein